MLSKTSGDLLKSRPHASSQVCYGQINQFVDDLGCSVTHALADSLGVASSPLDFFVIGVEEPEEERPATAGE